MYGYDVITFSRGIREGGIALLRTGFAYFEAKSLFQFLVIDRKSLVIYPSYIYDMI